MPRLVRNCAPGFFVVVSRDTVREVHVHLVAAQAPRVAVRAGREHLAAVLDAAVAGAHLDLGLELEVAGRAALPDDERVRVDHFLRRALADRSRRSRRARTSGRRPSPGTSRSAGPPPRPPPRPGWRLTGGLRRRCRRLALFGRRGLRVGARRQALAVEHALEAGAVFERRRVECRHRLRRLTAALARLPWPARRLRLPARRRRGPAGRPAAAARQRRARAQTKPATMAVDTPMPSRAPAIQFVHSHIILQNYWRGAPPPRLGPAPHTGAGCPLCLLRGLCARRALALRSGAAPPRARPGASSPWPLALLRVLVLDASPTSRSLPTPAPRR